jgi:hypothetical protein
VADPGGPKGLIPPDIFGILFTNNKYFKLCDNLIIIIDYTYISILETIGKVIAVIGMKTDKININKFNSGSATGTCM